MHATPAAKKKDIRVTDASTELATLERLLAAVALRDRGAFRRLYDASAAHLFGLSLRILKDRALAEEAVQEAYVQIWQHAGEYRSERGHPLAWMGSIARYRALDALRRRPEQISLDGDESVFVAPQLMAEPGPAPEAALQRCMERLPDETRRALQLAFVEGYTHGELSRRLRVPLGTLKSWIRRGLARLRECLEGAAA